MSIEDRITNLEKVTLILRSKVEPETLTFEALVRAKELASEKRCEKYVIVKFEA